MTIKIHFIIKNDRAVALSKKNSKDSVIFNNKNLKILCSNSIFRTKINLW